MIDDDDVGTARCAFAHPTLAVIARTIDYDPKSGTISTAQLSR
jgi:hypothetical protein